MVVYVQEPLVGRKQSMFLLNHDFVLLLWHTELIWREDYNID